MNVSVSSMDKRAWVSPCLEQLGVEATLGGTQPNPSECRSQNPNAAGIPNYCS